MPNPRSAPLGARDFTLDTYARLCDALRAGAFESLTFSDYLTWPDAKRPARCVLIRHDVESDLPHALRMAAVEREHGLVATYFYRVKRGFDPRPIAAMAALGQEIGYHYETLGQAWGDVDRALALFGEKLEQLRRIAPVRVASMHGSPIAPWDNRDIWTRAQPADFGLVGEVYRDVDYAQVDYFTDTGRTWHPFRNNIRDRAPAPPRHFVETTDELIALLGSGAVERLCLVVHPERWSATRLGWTVRACRDHTENAVKRTLAWLYRRFGLAGGPTRGEA